MAYLFDLINKRQGSTSESKNLSFWSSKSTSSSKFLLVPQNSAERVASYLYLSCKFKDKSFVTECTTFFIFENESAELAMFCNIVFSSVEPLSMSCMSSSTVALFRESVYSLNSSFSFYRFTMIKCFRLFSSTIISFTTKANKCKQIQMLLDIFTICIKFSIDFF